MDLKEISEVIQRWKSENPHRSIYLVQYTDYEGGAMDLEDCVQIQDGVKQEDPE